MSADLSCLHASLLVFLLAVTRRQRDTSKPEGPHTCAETHTFTVPLYVYTVALEKRGRGEGGGLVHQHGSQTARLMDGGWQKAMPEHDKPELWDISAPTA